MRPGPILQTGVLDMSASGMRLRSSLPVPCGTTVEVEIGRTVARGAICRCEPLEDSYELGIQVSSIDAT